MVSTEAEKKASMTTDASITEATITYNHRTSDIHYAQESGKPFDTPHHVMSSLHSSLAKKVLFRGRRSPRFGFNSCCSLNSLRERFNHMIGLNLVLSPVPLSPLLVDAKFNPNFDTRDTNPLCYFISLTFSTLLNLDEDDEESKTKFFLPVRCSRKPRGDCSRSSLPRAS
jgi:hypothetical protein